MAKIVCSLHTKFFELPEKPRQEGVYRDLIIIQLFDLFGSGSSGLGFLNRDLTSLVFLRKND
jgi:hypothetical protein